MSGHEPEISTDMLRGANEIAGFLFGDPKQRRKIYHLIASSRLPTFKLGSIICARRSVLQRWIKDQEIKNARRNPPE